MYLSPGVAGWLVGWAVGIVGLLAVYGATESPLGTGRVVAALAVLVALTLLSVWSMVVIVRRPQPAAPPDVIAADDATRRAAIRRVAAGWGVLQCMVSIVVGQWLEHRCREQSGRQHRCGRRLSRRRRCPRHLAGRADETVPAADHPGQARRPMIVAIDSESTLPPYEQLRVQIAGLIGGGSLPPGARLPAVRQLAADLGVAPGTVARAYRELEDDGWIEGRGRHGTVVRQDRPTKPPEQRQRRLRAETEILVSTARSLGASDAEVLEALRAALGR